MRCVEPSQPTKDRPSQFDLRINDFIDPMLAWFTNPAAA